MKEKLEKTLLYWKSLLQNYFVTDDDRVIILNTTDLDIVECISRFLCVLRVKYGIQDILLISDNAEIEKCVRENTMCDYKFIVVDYKWINNLRLFPSTHYIFDVIYMCSFESEITNGFELVGMNDITREDIVAHSFLRLADTPDDIEIDICESTFKKQKIVWKSFGEFIPLRKWSGESDCEFTISNIINYLEKNDVSINRPIYLFGATDWLQDCIDVLKNYNVKCVFDNFSTEKKYSIRITQPNCEGINEDYGLVIIATSHYKAVCEQLLDKNICIRDVVIANNKYYWWNGDDSNIAYQVNDMVVQGKAIYSEIIEKYPNRRIILTPLPGTGDVYILGLYLISYLEENGIDDYTFLVISKGLRTVAEMLSIKCDVLQKDEMDRLYFWSRSSLNISQELIFWDQNIYQRQTNYLQGVNGLDYNSMIATLLFHRDKVKIPKHLVSECADFLFYEKKLRQNKTILIAPYAKTVSQIDNTFWIELVKKLNDMGFDVCTNVSDTESSIEGTKSIYIPYNQIIDFANKCYAIIGVRSGLLDIISSANSKLIAIYAGKMFSTGKSMMDFFGIRNMGLKDNNILELEYCSESEMVEQITRWL